MAAKHVPAPPVDRAKARLSLVLERLSRAKDATEPEPIEPADAAALHGLDAPQSFEAYAEARFGFKQAYSWRLRAAAQVVDVIGDHANWHGVPSAEGTIRPLTRLLPRRSDEIEPEQRDRIEAAWARACKLAEDEGATVTGRHVKAAVDEVAGRKPKGPALAPARPLSIADLTDVFEADDSEFATKYAAVKDDLFRFRAAINATIRKAEQMGIGPHVVMVGEAK